jgi:hypothetical protein
MADAGRPSPEVYRLSIPKLPLAVARAWRFETFRVLVAATLATALLTALTSTPREALDVALGVGAVVLVGLPYVFWRAATRIRRHWNAFELAVGAETVRVVAKGGGRITIRYDQIAAITEGTTGLVVTSVEPGVIVKVPRLVEAFSDVRARLAALRPISPRPETAGRLMALLGAGVVVGIAIAFPQVPGGLAIGLTLSQMAAAVVVGGDIRGNPVLAPEKRALAVVVAIGAALLPLGGLYLR